MSEIGLPKSYSNFTKVCSFKGDPERWSRFKETCKTWIPEKPPSPDYFSNFPFPGVGVKPPLLEDHLKRGVSICHVLDALQEAWIQGQKATATVIKPVVVNLTMQHVVKRPRRALSFEDVMYEARRKNWPPPCDKADDFVKSTKEVGCLEIKDHIKLEKCWRCFLTRGGP